MYFDSHAHLDDTRFEKDFDEILARMRENGVTGMMNIGCDLPSSERSVGLAERFGWVWAAVGSHPDDAARVDDGLVAMYRQLAAHPKVRAIGEIGLDYYYEDVPREKQKEAFRLQMELARELGLPAHKIHCSVLAEQAVKAAVKDYYDKNGIAYEPETLCGGDCACCHAHD